MPRSIVAMTEQQFRECSNERNIPLNAVRMESSDSADPKPIALVYSTSDRDWAKVDFDDLAGVIETRLSAEETLAVIDPHKLWPGDWAPLTPFDVWESKLPR